MSVWLLPPRRGRGSASALPPSDPQAIRACLTPALASEFDREWEIVLERAKQSKDLAGVYELLTKWRHTIYMERCESGSYSRMLARAEQILRTGHNRMRRRLRTCRR